MSILGVFLFTIILFSYSAILLAKNIHYSISHIITKQSNPSSYLIKIQNLSLYLQTEEFRNYSGYLAFLFALWNLFGPDFGSIHGGPTLIGALIPTIILFLDAIIISPNILEMFPLNLIKERISPILVSMTPIAGWITLAVAIAHMMLYKFPFF